MPIPKKEWDEEVLKILSELPPLVSPIVGKENIINYTKCLLGKDSKDVDILFHDKLFCVRTESTRGILGKGVHKKLRKYIHEEERIAGEKFNREENNDSMLMFLDWIDRNSDSNRGYIVYAFEAVEKQLVWHEVSHVKTGKFCWGLRHEDKPYDKSARKDTEYHADMYAVCLAMIRGYDEIEKELLSQERISSDEYKKMGFMERYDYLKYLWKTKTFGIAWESSNYYCVMAPDHERLLINAIRKYIRPLISLSAPPTNT